MMRKTKRQSEKTLGGRRLGGHRVDCTCSHSKCTCAKYQDINRETKKTENTKEQTNRRKRKNGDDCKNEKRMAAIYTDRWYLSANNEQFSEAPCLMQIKMMFKYLIYFLYFYLCYIYIFYIFYFSIFQFLYFSIILCMLCSN